MQNDFILHLFFSFYRGDFASSQPFHVATFGCYLVGIKKMCGRRIANEQNYSFTEACIEKIDVLHEKLCGETHYRFETNKAPSNLSVRMQFPIVTNCKICQRSTQLNISKNSKSRSSFSVESLNRRL